MKRSNYLCLVLMMSSLGMLLGGCLTKPERVSTRHFVLVPIPAPEPAPTTAQQSSIEVGFVKMPAYLLRDSMFVRKSTTEIEYLEAALWAERLDQSFRQTLAENLSLLLVSNRACRSGSEHDQVAMRVSVSVEQFDVDAEGRGTLLAGWRLTAAGSEKPIKSGQARLIRPGPAPRGNPQAIAATLSALLAEFSRELAPALRESAQARQ